MHDSSEAANLQMQYITKSIWT